MKAGPVPEKDSVNQPTAKRRWLAWLILIALVFTWGSSFILMKIGLTVFPPMQLGALRISLVFIFLIPFLVVRFRKVKRRQWHIFLISGMVGSGIPAFLFAYAQSGIDSSLSGILNSLTPLFTMLIGMWFFRYKGAWYNVVGVFIGLAGAVGLMAASGGGDLAFNFSYAWYVILATLCYAVNINLVKTYLKDTDAISITTYGVGSVGIPCLVYLLAFTDFIPRMLHHPDAWYGLSIVNILAVVGTGLALMLYNYMIKISNVVFAASVTYLMPVVAIFWGVLDDEVFRLINILYIALVLLGVFLVNGHFGKGHQKA